MRPLRQRLNWAYDDCRQEFATPAGRVISLYEIATMLQDQLACHHDFHGPWAGWKMRGDTLIPPRSNPRGPRLKPHNAAAFARWVTGEDRNVGAPGIAPTRADHPHGESSLHETVECALTR